MEHPAGQGAVAVHTDSAERTVGAFAALVILVAAPCMMAVAFGTQLDLWGANDCCSLVGPVYQAWHSEAVVAPDMVA